MQTSGYTNYRTVTTTTASPGALLLQLYQAAIRNIGQAQIAIGRNDIPGAHTHIIRAQDIVTELQRTLDHERGGEIAERLAPLYIYMRQRLITANIYKDVVPLAEVQGLLRQLLSAWQAAVQQAGRTIAPAQATRPAVPVQTAPPNRRPLSALAG